MICSEARFLEIQLSIEIQDINIKICLNDIT